MTIAFQAKVENNAILIPDVYRKFITDNVLVTVSVNERKEHKKDKKMPYCIGIDMSGFKFDREEANER